MSFLKIQGLLAPAELDIIDRLVRSARFEDGAATATDAAKAVKRNLQLPKAGSPEKQQIDAVIVNAVIRNPQIQSALTPVRILPPIIGKYEPGMHYGMHVDSPVMGDPQTGPIRTDVGMTIFLADPLEYEGGELAVHTPTGVTNYKLDRGDAIIYPTTQVHGVLPVTAGVRLVAVSWMQCAVRDPQKREILFQIKSAQALLEKHEAQSEENLALLQALGNLTRMWMELA